ncbi:putative cyclin-dependent serine/threonine-protein kinase DDB_G0272797/DDB_G0274007 isoform X6 [Drosophila innubila]|uniref:putative cyclin-dependent serine/threonine-protein kinase DDB_G0272797/DDB_G0274007 isoform X6 n=1 Tax=Drosophila innubila TaxID=198719 RepID=UPI00148D8593|nr:putative cyclin-dependent serine/threonine-protein kinase DDB_G0272797/DDB_G0274007 isoform X6 [Drosophila innubila]
MIEVDEQITKPLNLAMSAVLRAVEEEEKQVNCGYKRVAWPPASEERIVREFTPQPQQSPAPGSGGYYPQATASGNAAPPQVPIYNNVQPRTQQQPQQPTQQQPPQPQQHYQQQYHQQQAAQNVYGPNTNYASNGYAPAATVAAPPATATANATQVPANNYNYPQQPIQYTQAQFNRQPSREPAPVPQQQQQQQQQQQPQQQHYQPTYQQQQQQPIHAVDNVGGGWKHIGAPSPKTHSDFTAAGVAPTAAYPSYQQQQQQQQQYPHQQQYQAPSSDNHQQQQQQPLQQHQPAPQHWQQQQQQHQPQPQQQYQAPYQTSPYQQQQQQQQPQNYPQQNGGANYAQPQYNSYSQPQQLQPQQQQQLPYSQDQTDLQQHSYRGASPGIITLRKEAPVSQQPAPVYTSQPAAVSYQGGSKLRGDLKWPPQEYKEAAVRENEERRLLALGPVCRPRRVNRDYTTFFAKHQLNCTYPSYKVPPGTQHMFG